MAEQNPAEANSADSSAEANKPRNLVRDLIDSGIHFGHRSSRWNPKMAPFIYGKRNKIHIIDVRETLKGLLRAKKYLAQVVASGEDVVFVGTKRQAKQAIKEQAQRCEMPYVNERWLGGMLTNFRTIRSRLGRLEELEALDEAGQLDAFSKKQASSLRREKRKILRNLGGIRTMNRLPAAMVIVDLRREHIAVKEAQKVGVATISLIDTDSDPDYADLPIPGNDDAMRGIELVLTELADAVIEGKVGRAAAREVAGKAADLPAGPPAERRRSRRSTTSRRYEQKLTPTEQKLATRPPSVLEVTAPAGAEAAAGEPTPADAEPAGPAESAAASPAAEPPSPVDAPAEPAGPAEGAAASPAAEPPSPVDAPAEPAGPAGAAAASPAAEPPSPVDAPAERSAPAEDKQDAPDAADRPHASPPDESPAQDEQKSN